MTVYWNLNLYNDRADKCMRFFEYHIFLESSFFVQQHCLSMIAVVPLKMHRRRKRAGGGGQPPLNNLRGGGGQHTLWPPNNPPTFSFNFYVKQEKITNVPS